MNHIEQIQNAVNFIEENLRNEELSIQEIASRAGYSQWHFQRVFTATVGEGVMEYVRKRRLTAALRELGGGERRILDIALDCGFDSQEAFTRAFKARFGKTPGEARKLGVIHGFALDKPKITMAYLDHLYRGMNMEPKIIEKPAFHVLGMGAPFISILSPEKTNHVVIPALWGRYLARAAEIQARKGFTDYGLVFCEETSTKGECYYVAGAEVAADTPVPEGFELRTIPAATYAVFTHIGSLEKLGHTMNYIFGSWLPKSGRRLAGGPDVEIYGEKFRPGAEDSELEICIPIA